MNGLAKTDNRSHWIPAYAGMTNKEGFWSLPVVALTKKRDSSRDPSASKLPAHHRFIGRSRVSQCQRRQVAPRGDVLRKTSLWPIVTQRFERGFQRIVTAYFLFVAQAAPAAAMLHDAKQSGFCGKNILSQHSGYVFGFGAGVLYASVVTNLSAESDVLISLFRLLRKYGPRQKSGPIVPSSHLCRYSFGAT